MRWKSSPERYGTIAIAIHWITALAIFALLGSGWVAAGIADDAAKASILRIHMVVGVAVLALTLLRILWWLAADARPAPHGNLPSWQRRASRLVHAALYALVIVMGASGLGMILLSGAAAILWFGAPGPLPDFHAYPPRAAHGVGFLALLALVALHVAAALHHQFVRRDRLLARMGVGG